jgi:Glyoxalase-like domain
MPRPLHHVTHAVHRLDAVADVYTRLGFQVSGRNRHAFGTHNRIVQLPGFYVELLEVAEPEKIIPHAARSFSFGAFNRDFLARQEGLSMLAVESRDARADAEAFLTAGIGDFEPLDFERASQRSDGSTAKVAFSLAFARDPTAQDIGWFTCQEHFPENFWEPAAQAHANTASAIAGIILVADNPSDQHIFLSAFTGQRDLNATSSGITAKTSRGEIQVMAPAAFAGHFGIAAPDTARGARLAAMRIAVRSFAAVLTTLQAANVAAAVRMGRIVVGPAIAAGATIVFEQG